MSRNRWLVCVALFAGLSACVCARAETVLGIHAVSYHAKDGYNNVNPGVYVSLNGYTIGSYYNSERKQTYYAGYNFSGELVGPLDWGLAVGVASGYKRASVVPMVVPSVRFDLGNGFGARVSAIPPLPGVPFVAHLSIETRF